MESNACTAFVEARKHDQLVYREYGRSVTATRRFRPLRVPYQLEHHDGQRPFIDALYPKAIASSTEDQLKQITRK